jgi:hypothetical protein
MTADDRRSRRELEAVAFGRAITVAERAEAALAAEELGRLGAADAAEELRRVWAVDAAEAARPGIVEEHAPPPSAEGEAVVPETETELVRPRGLLRRFWPIPAIVAAFVLGGILGANLGSPSSNTRADAGIVQVIPTGAADPLTAGEAALNSARSSADTFPNEMALEYANINSSTTHLVGSSNGSSVWIGRGLSGSLCLIAYSSISGTFPSDCEKAQDFGKFGVTLAFDAGTVHWDGASLSTDWKHK